MIKKNFKQNTHRQKYETLELFASFFLTGDSYDSQECYENCNS